MKLNGCFIFFKKKFRTILEIRGKNKIYRLVRLIVRRLFAITLRRARPWAHGLIIKSEKKNRKCISNKGKRETYKKRIQQTCTYRFLVDSSGPEFVWFSKVEFIDEMEGFRCRNCGGFAWGWLRV